MDEVDWIVAVEAVPWLIGTSKPDRPIRANELFARLVPFQDEVAEDSRRNGEE
jgi:hypothetical protein